MTRLELTPTEYKLLYHLVRNAGHVLTHATLLAKVWGREYVDEVDYLRVYVRRLRDKLGDDPDRPRYIRTERGLGYRFIADDRAPAPGNARSTRRPGTCSPSPIGAARSQAHVRERIALDDEQVGDLPDRRSCRPRRRCPGVGRADDVAAWMACIGVAPWSCSRAISRQTRSAVTPTSPVSVPVASGTPSRMAASVEARWVGAR